MRVAHHVFQKACFCTLALLPLWARLACATDNYAYRSGEYAMISGGKSADGVWSIAAHGDGEYGNEGFKLYLMREPQHEVSTSIRTGEHLDTAPLSNIALWSPDSCHVATLYRTDRHIMDLRLFGVVDGKVRSMEVPSLVDTIGRGHSKPGVSQELFSRYYRVIWRTANRLTLEEFDTFDAAEPVFDAEMKAYTKVDRYAGHTFTDFAARAVYVFTKGGELRLLETTPQHDRERTVVYSPHLRVDSQLGLHSTETTMSSLEAQKGQQ